MSTLRLDPDYQRAVAPFATIVPPVADDAATLRRFNNAAIAASMTLYHVPENNTTETKLDYTSLDGTPLTLHRFTPGPNNTTTTTTSPAGKPAVLYIHGGGFVSGSVPLFRKDIIAYATLSNTTFFAPAYRLAPESPHPLPLQDIYAALEYLHAHAAELAIDPARIALMGVSAGGGLAAAAALLARDRRLEPRVARLVLVYPMLDDRTRLGGEGSLLSGHLTWTEKKNEIGWGAYLGDGAARGRDGGDDDGGATGKVPQQYAAPARAEDVSGLPRTYIDVGGLDLFRGECMEFGARLASALVDVEFHLYPGVPHAWEWVSGNAPVTKQAVENRVRVLRDL
ncbi:Alpha/Beta hydrolase protein [Chaetomidium leptoderma]|uniref:Alpha/Beta hydrolase protein n=1 Tax=Chaetomidium leptoderma TaxID=669021 RepID=A0AAN6ZV95_9PEZI|nr:Alpha/Beta hydrolase protein [Chaetomidium leptoderma]